MNKTEELFQEYLNIMPSGMTGHELVKMFTKVLSQLPEFNDGEELTELRKKFSDWYLEQPQGLRDIFKFFMEDYTAIPVELLANKFNRELLRLRFKKFLRNNFPDLSAAEIAELSLLFSSWLEDQIEDEEEENQVVNIPAPGQTLEI